jgi:hypothetical protein
MVSHLAYGTMKKNLRILSSFAPRKNAEKALFRGAKGDIDDSFPSVFHPCSISGQVPFSRRMQPVRGVDLFSSRCSLDWRTTQDNLNLWKPSCQDDLAVREVGGGLRPPKWD